MQVNEKKRDGIEAEQEECRSVLGTPGEIGEAAEKFHGSVKGSGPEKRQAQAKNVEGQNALCPQGEKAGGRSGRTTGGGPGIMEAANLGAYEAGGKTIGLNINLPFEQMCNPYITPSLNFEFHYFFMRKFWFAYLAKALVIFPGGFGTMDELFEILTLAQTQKLAKKILVVIYGSEYWHRVVNFQAMVDAGTISAEDLDLFKIVDTPEEGFEYLREGLTKYHLVPESKRAGERVPEIAKTNP